MIVVRKIGETRNVISEERRRGRRIGFVPTMGALHEGHLSLVREARKHADFIVVSIFVNPTQFGPSEDLARYPRTPEKDSELLRRESVDLVFTPTASEMYGTGSQVIVDPGPVGSTFEGKIRPGHFEGVLTVVAKLFNVIQPHAAVFGQKDAQQLFLIRRMVQNLDFPIEIIEGDTIREADGLAMSSRNAYLKTAERSRAGVLFAALTAGKRLLVSGTSDLISIRKVMNKALAAVPDFSPEYATAVDESSFEEADPVPDHARLIVAGRLGSVRLIDNMRTY